MANDVRAINDIYRNGLNAAYGELPRSQNRLPKTGQTTSYQAGDDGDNQAGVSEPEIRFEIQTLSGDDVVIDHHTGLMWVRSRTSAGCNYGTKLDWSSGITFCNDLVYAGFDDWRMPNLFEGISLWDPVNEILVSSFLGFTSSAYSFWSSTSRHSYTANALYVYLSYYPVNQTAKTNSYTVLPCRSI